MLIMIDVHLQFVVILARGWSLGSIGAAAPSEAEIKPNRRCDPSEGRGSKQGPPLQGICPAGGSEIFVY